MTPVTILALCVCALILGAIAITNKPHLMAAAMSGGDEDMKIAHRHFSPAAEAEDSVQAEVEDFLRQKSVGNISRARQLGVQYASLLMREAQENFDPWPENMAQSLRAHHQLLMFSYVVNRVVAELSPNSILAHTALNVFYDTLEEKAPQLDKYVKDMASYSLYVLCERSDTCTLDQIGKIYARLCGDKGNGQLEQEGLAHYTAYYEACSKLHRQAGYAQT